MADSIKQRAIYIIRRQLLEGLFFFCIFLQKTKLKNISTQIEIQYNLDSQLVEVLHSVGLGLKSGSCNIKTMLSFAKWTP